MHVLFQDIKYACKKSVIGYKAVITFVLRAYQKLCSTNILAKIILIILKLFNKEWRPTLYQFFQRRLFHVNFKIKKEKSDENESDT